MSIDTQKLRRLSKKLTPGPSHSEYGIIGRAAEKIDAQATEIERLRGALEWYASISKQMGKAALRGDSQAMLTLMKELAVDYGGKARAALAQEQGGSDAESD